MPVGGAAPEQDDLQAALRLAAGTPSTDLRRARALKRARASGEGLPFEWLMDIAVPAAWHLVAEALGVAPGTTIVECGEHAGGQHRDIVIWDRNDEGRPRLFITWTSGTLCSDNDTNPLDCHYPDEFISDRLALVASVRERFAGEGPDGDPSRLCAAQLIAQLTEPPRPLALVPSEDPERNQSWALADPHGYEVLDVNMGSGTVRFPDGSEKSATSVLTDLLERGPECLLGS